MTYKTKNCPTNRDFAKQNLAKKKKELPFWMVIFMTIFSIAMVEGLLCLAINEELTVKGILSFVTFGVL